MWQAYLVDFLHKTPLFFVCMCRYTVSGNGAAVIFCVWSSILYQANICDGVEYFMGDGIA